MNTQDILKAIRQDYGIEDDQSFSIINIEGLPRFIAVDNYMNLCPVYSSDTASVPGGKYLPSYALNDKDLVDYFPADFWSLVKQHKGIMPDTVSLYVEYNRQLDIDHVWLIFDQGQHTLRYTNRYSCSDKEPDPFVYMLMDNFDKGFIYLEERLGKQTAIIQDLCDAFADGTIDPMSPAYFSMAGWISSSKPLRQPEFFSQRSVTDISSLFTGLDFSLGTAPTIYPNRKRVDFLDPQEDVYNTIGCWGYKVLSSIQDLLPPGMYLTTTRLGKSRGYGVLLYPSDYSFEFIFMEDLDLSSPGLNASNFTDQVLRSRIQAVLSSGALDNVRQAVELSETNTTPFFAYRVQNGQPEIVTDLEDRNVAHPLYTIN